MIRTLIVEDEQWVRKGIIKMINWDELGMELIGEAKNGREALAIFETNPVELLITDMKMPGGSGIELLRTLEHKSANLQIIVFSGFSDYEYMRQAISSNVFEYILKPVDGQELNEVLKRVICKINKKRKEQDQQRHIKSTLDANMKLITENELNHLLEGGISGEDIIVEKYKNIGVDLSYNYYLIADIFFRLQQADGSTVRRKDGEIVKDVIDEMINDVDGLIAKKISCNIFRNIHNQNELIMLYKSNCDSKNFQVLRMLSRDILMLLKHKYNMWVRIGVGDWSEGLKGIRDSYLQARRALKYECRQINDIILFSSVNNITHTDVPDFIEEKQLIHIIQTSGYSEIVQLIHTIFCDIRKQEYCKLSNLRKAIIDFMHIFERSCQKLGFDISINSLYNESYIDILDEFYSIDELETWTIVTIEMIIELIVCRKQNQNINVIQEIRNYIENNYNEDINLISLSQRYYMNHIYLSRLFKSQTGENFIDYLTRVRMTRAKGFIEKGNFKVKEVAELVGYSNPYYFSSSYKKFFGYTPGKRK